MKKFSEYIIYVDESGSQNLTKIDTQYPVFVLAFIIVKKSEYFKQISPAIQEIKFKYWGHDSIIFHEHEIRKSARPFDILMNSEIRTDFINDINSLVLNSPFSLTAAIIDKLLLKEIFNSSKDPYELALNFCLQQSETFLKSFGEKNAITHIILESRGDTEDQILKQYFQELLRYTSYGNIKFELLFASKHSNSGGLQLADLIARPLGINYLKPEQLNKAYQVIKQKFENNTGGKQRFFQRVFPQNSKNP